MVEGAPKLTLDDHSSAGLAEQAKAMGVTPETLAVDLLLQTPIDNEAFAARQGDHISNHDLNEERPSLGRGPT